METKIKVMLADPNEDFCTLMRSTLSDEPDMEVVGTAPDGVEAMARGGVVAVMLPATAYSLRKPFARARTMIDKGVPVALVSVPLRYMHSSVEVGNWNDLEACIELIAEFLLRIDADFDYSPLTVL